jgi:hypothetical protein
MRSATFETGLRLKFSVTCKLIDCNIASQCCSQENIRFDCIPLSVILISNFLIKQFSLLGLVKVSNLSGHQSIPIILGHAMLQDSQSPHTSGTKMVLNLLAGISLIYLSNIGTVYYTN